MCCRCIARLLSSTIDDTCVSSDDQSAYESVHNISTLISASALGFSTLKISKDSQIDISSDAKRKCGTSI